MDILDEKRMLIEAVDAKIIQFQDLKQKLIDEHNAEVMRRQQAAAAAQQPQTPAEESPAEVDAKEEKKETKK